LAAELQPIELKTAPSRRRFCLSRVMPLAFPAARLTAAAP
jgi:hypothetical protein